jgi:hypothetical protein
MRTTTDICSHVLPALAREAADQMGRTLWDTTPSADPLRKRATKMAPRQERGPARVIGKGL